jgi:hypothetical protein
VRLKRARGVAMAAALMLILFLMVMGMAHLTIVQQDQSFANYQQQSTQVYYMALSGIEYQRMYPEKFPIGTTMRIMLPNGDRSEYAEVRVDADGTISSTGILVDSLDYELARRALVVPLGDLQRIYERPVQVTYVKSDTAQHVFRPRFSSNALLLR